MPLDLWSTGVVLKYGYAGGGRHGWVAEINWCDSKFCEEKAVQGTITTTYFEETIEKAIDTVMEVFEKFKLRKVGDELVGFNLYYIGDGEDEEYPPPKGYIKLLREEAHKRGWKTYSREEE
jgi:hypothetical protein